MLVGPIKCLKQIIQIELNRVKNPNWPEANQLAINKRGRGFELGTTMNKSSKWSGRDLNSGPSNCKSGAQIKPLGHAASYCDFDCNNLFIYRLLLLKRFTSYFLKINKRCTLNFLKDTACFALITKKISSTNKQKNQDQMLRYEILP